MTGRGPQALTLVVAARLGGLPRLSATLSRWEKAVPSALEATPSLGHLALSALPSPDGGAALLLETTFEGELEPHLGELWRAIGDALADVGSACEIVELQSAPAFLELARERSSRVHALYVAHAPAPERAAVAPFLERAAVFALSPLYELDERLRRGRGARSLGAAADAPAETWHRGRAPFVAVFAVRPQRFRTNALRRALRLADSMFASGGFRNQGPGGLAALHTARFVLLPGDRLLVTALVDGPLAVFFDRLSETKAPLLSAIFMHTQGFPETRFGFFGGARRNRNFRHWIRSFQRPAGIWYSAYPDLLR